MYLFIALSLLLAVPALGFAGIGDRLQVTFPFYTSRPITLDAARWQGYYKISSECDPHLGNRYSNALLGIQTSLQPVDLYFTAGGQISGVAVTHYGTPTSGAGDYWVRVEEPDLVPKYVMKVGFRSASDDLCNPNVTLNEPLGTQVVINPGGLHLGLPLTSAEAIADKYTRGSCIQGMGIHWSYDLVTAPKMSWKQKDIAPAVVIYRAGEISGFFVASATLQTIAPLGPWEGPFPNLIMCKNWCDANCSWDQLLSLWTTLHFFFTDPSLNDCPSILDVCVNAMGNDPNYDIDSGKSNNEPQQPSLDSTGGSFEESTTNEIPYEEETTSQ